jgi:hypothetical protein
MRPGAWLIGDGNRVNRATQRRQRIGKADIGEQVPAGRADRRGATIDAFGGQVGGVFTFDHMGRDPCLAAANASVMPTRPPPE